MKSPKNSANPQTPGAESGALAASKVTTCPELARLINAWPNLPAPVRRGILAMVEAAKEDRC